MPSLLDVFEDRRQLIAYFHMWYPGKPAPEQCEGCTLYSSQVRELSYLHSRDVTYATFCYGPYEETARYRDFIGLDVPWYSVQDSAETLLAGRPFNRFAGLLLASRRQSVRDLLDDRTRCRGAGFGLCGVARPDRLRQAGELGGLARRLAEAMGARYGGAQSVSHQRAPHRPVAAANRRTIGRPRQRPPVTRCGSALSAVSEPVRGSPGSIAFF
jgi:Bacterial protein of unknown function (DUF899)